MKVQGTETIYPYLQSDGRIELKTFHVEGAGCFGICMVEKDAGIAIEFEIEVDTSQGTSVLAVRAFNAQIESVRAKAQLEVESIEKAKQKFLALEVTA